MKRSTALYKEMKFWQSQIIEKPKTAEERTNNKCCRAWIKDLRKKFYRAVEQERPLKRKKKHVR